MYEGPWFYKISRLILRHWTPFFNPEIPGPLKIPIWVKLPYLPNDFRYPDRLKKISSMIGKVLKIDDQIINHNTRGVARVCVEINMDKPLKEVINIQVEIRTFTV